MRKVSSMQTFEQQTVLVTGGNSGIGRAIATGFAQRGARVIIIGRDEERLRATAAELGPRASWYQGDVADSRQVRAIISAITKEQERIDILVNAAGFTGGVTTDMPFEE